MILSRRGREALPQGRTQLLQEGRQLLQMASTYRVALGLEGVGVSGEAFYFIG